MKRRIENWQKSQWKLRSKKTKNDQNIQFSEDTLFIGAAFGDDIRSGIEDMIEVNNLQPNI